MGMTYFRRYRMERSLDHLENSVIDWSGSVEYQFVPFDEGLLRDHAQAKFQSFRCEMDADVFPCLGVRDGCLRLMREITSRASFVAGATWLVQYRDRPGGRAMPVGTVQGIEQDGWGAIQNLGIMPEHRGQGLGQQLMALAAAGFHSAGLKKMTLEVTTANVSAIRLYERLGFHKAKVVYKSCDVAGV